MSTASRARSVTVLVLIDVSETGSMDESPGSELVMTFIDAPEIES
jgi:hypothetical protein